MDNPILPKWIVESSRQRNASIVGREHDDRVFHHSFVLEGFDHLSHSNIHGDHHRTVYAPPGVFDVTAGLLESFRRDEGVVRRGVGQEEKHRTVRVVVVHQTNGLLRQEEGVVGRVLPLGLKAAPEIEPATHELKMRNYVNGCQIVNYGAEIVPAL